MEQSKGSGGGMGRLAGVLVLWLASCSNPPRPSEHRFVFPDQGRVVDLSVGGGPGASGEEGQGTWLRASAPPPVGRCIAPLVVIDQREAVLYQPGVVLSREDLTEWERRYGEVPFGAVVAVRSGWSAMRARKDRFLGEGTEGVAGHPGVSLAVMEVLLRERGVAGILVETPVLHPTKDGLARQLFDDEGAYSVVGLAALDSLPETGCLCIVAPFPGEVGRVPVRIYAIAPRTVRSRRF